MQQVIENNQSNTVLPKFKKKSEERLQRLISEHKGNLAASFEDLLGPTTGQTQEEIQGEIDAFLRMRKEWRKESADRDFD